MIRSLAVLCICLCLPARVFAWGLEGHMVVAQTAYNHLDSVVKNRCDALIALTLTNSSSATTNFVTAACWADDFKGVLGTGIWHYIDQPFSLDGAPTNGVGAAPFDVVRAINLCIVTLQDTNATVTNRATYLRYLLHFVGDIHQPLHCCTAVSSNQLGGDAGGNGFGVSGWSNLHSLWDQGGGFVGDFVSRPLSAAGQTTLSNKVAIIEAVYPFTSNPGTIPDPQSWAVEGLNLAQSVCYANITSGSAPSSTYLTSATNTSEARLALGGKRLADLLNTIFAPTPLSLTALPLTNNNFRFSWSATNSASYRIQWKQNLTNTAWNDLTDVVASASSVTFTNTVTQSQRFYRVVGLP
jgi:hypothetical protein